MQEQHDVHFFLAWLADDTQLVI